MPVAKGMKLKEKEARIQRCRVSLENWKTHTSHTMLIDLLDVLADDLF